MENRRALMVSLNQTASSSPGSVSNADLLKATSDYNAAYDAWNMAPDAVKTASGSTSTDPAIIMCEAISSPAVLVNQGINAMIDSYAKGALTQYNSNNLPAYINTISGVAAQIGTSMVLGGLGAGASSALINENQVVSATAALAGSTAAAGAASTSAASAIQFYISSSDGQGNFTLNWDVMTTLLTTASYVTISGIGAPSGPQQVFGSATVSPTSTATYIMTVFDPTGKNLGSSSLWHFARLPAILQLQPQRSGRGRRVYR